MLKSRGGVFRSLRLRLVVFVFLASVPALGLILYQAQNERREAQERAEEQAIFIAETVSSRQAEAINQSRGLLVTLSQLFALVPTPLSEIQPDTCNRFLASLITQPSVYTNVKVVTAEGKLACSALPSDTVLTSYANEPYFAGAVKTGGFFTGGFQVDPGTNTPVVNTSFPVVGANRQTKGVIFATIDLTKVSDLASESGFPDGTVVNVIVPGGTVIMHSPTSPEWIGRDVSQSKVVDTAATLAMSRVVRTGDLDGVDRVFGVTPLLSTLGSNSPIVTVGIPTSVAFADANAGLRRNLFGILVTTLLMALVAWWAGDVFFVRKINKVVQATDLVAGGDLTARSGVPYNSGEIGQLAYAFDEMTEKLKSRQDEIQAMNEQLEKKVEERTQQLQLANRELEAFSYSVSHDLRAPLRAVAGFSQILLEEQEAKLDEEGKRHLQIIRSNTEKMGQLIDDLLAFSRVGRKEMQQSQIDMTQLAREVFEEVRKAEPNRKISFHVNELPTTRGDFAMFHQVFENLLSNAVKFTRPREEAIIEVGGSSNENENLYYVKDNGAGFDMKYIGKLFGVFQRLHSDEEFEGTGVGLALVQRIVQRHGGRVWAEAEVNQGATLSFSLPIKGTTDARTN